MKQVIFTSSKPEGLTVRRAFKHYIYGRPNPSGLPVELRQHLLRELVKLRNGEITDIHITLTGSDGRFK